VETAILLATARRRARSADDPPLPPVRSLRYYLPVIEELRTRPLPGGYAEYLARRLAETETP